MSKKVPTSYIILDTVFSGDEVDNPEGTTVVKEVGQQYAVSEAQAVARWKYKVGFIEGNHATGRRFEEHTLSAKRESDWRREHE